MKFLLVPQWGVRFYPRLREKYRGESSVEAYSPADVQRGIADADAVFGHITGGRLAAARKLTWEQRTGAGAEGLFSRVPQITDSASGANLPVCYFRYSLSGCGEHTDAAAPARPDFRVLAAGLRI